MDNQFNNMVEECVYKIFVKICKLFIIFGLSVVIYAFIIHPYAGVTKDTDSFTRLLVDMIAMLWAINTFELILRDFPQLREKLAWLIN